jgi:hypothetical protein
MNRRKGEITARKNERDYPHIVELLLPSGGFPIQRCAGLSPRARHRAPPWPRQLCRRAILCPFLLRRSCARRCLPRKIWWREADCVANVSAPLEINCSADRLI